MANFDAKYEIWKNSLLDLGKRNKLLNYKETKSSTIKITYPNLSDLYDSFVKEENELVFPRYIADPSSEDDAEETAFQIEDATEKGDFGGYGSPLRTSRNVKDLQRVLRNLRNKAKVAVEEQGINILYLSFGFLKYTEIEHSKTAFLAPLVLVPVTLTIESITSPYVLKLHEDEIVVNPTLAYLLDREYALKLPSFDSNGDISAFLDEVEELVKDNHWTVVRNVGLSLLSFLKINMYVDLETHKETISANPVVRALAGDGSALEKIPDDISDYDFDKSEKPTEVFQIVDADASQKEAILYAKKGISFVLQGPPGTGKSQTITNIIAECLASGKKVLFVSEKMAALEVVHHRISLAGLDDFCLVLHSQKTSKRNVLDQLERVLKLADKKATLSDTAFQKLSTLDYDKKQLNSYAEQIYAVVSPLEKSIYEVNGILANLDPYEDVIFGLPNVRKTDRNKLIKYLQFLELYSNTIGKMSDDFRSNPWRGSNLSAVTNEFRRDTTSKLSLLLPTLERKRKRVDEIYDALFSESIPSLNGIRNVIASLEGLENAVEIPNEWVTGDLIPLDEEIGSCVEQQTKINEIIDQIMQYAETLSTHSVINPVNKQDLFDVDKVINHREAVSKIISDQDPFFRWSESTYSEIISLFTEAKEKAERINSLKAELSEQFEDSIYDIDYEGILSRFKTEYTNLFKVFKGTYKADKKTFLGCHKVIGHKVSDSEILGTIDKLKEIDSLRKWFSDSTVVLNEFFADTINDESSDYGRVELDLKLFSLLTQLGNNFVVLEEKLVSFNANESALQDHYQFLYNGIFTDWTSVSTAWKWAKKFRESIITNEPSQSFVKQVCSSEEYAASCVDLRHELTEIDFTIRKEIEWFTNLFNDPEVFNELNLRELYDRLDGCMTGMALLEEWIDFRTARENCCAEGLGEAVSAIENDNIPTANIIPVFKKRFFSLWLDSVLPEYPAVQNFRRKTQEKTIQEFASLDKSQFSIARDRIKSKLINDLPSMDHFSSGQDEISILKRELAKTRRIMPIRKLFREIPNLLLTLKPCLMMSPLSVSLFLEADSYKFDTVIFDEASQVYTENAIGAISRGKQVIIAGDSKQLPPTSFFQAASTEGYYDDYDDDDEEDIPVYDSILEEANMLPERTLRWHYRSRHENLIAFSNAKIYKNRLVTFPSNIEGDQDNGVEYVYVPEGYYDRGGRKGNVVEARKVAQMVFDHFKTHPERSLGVIAFGEVQQYAIENVLREMRLADQSFESFFDESKNEAFFVKSLENVQGDERDTIIFSIGYAKDAAGVFRNQFGPLGKTGGERRLNVAITRAKYNVKLVGSILPSDINEEAVTTEGPKLLKAYIDYALNGPDILARELTYEDSAVFDSPFEEAVFNFLDRKGYKLVTQVGCSGYRIDIGVKHPKLNGVFVLGIECDGAAYHSARTARERDRLRQDVLESMGWTIYRIWSTDWIKDPVSEGQLLIEAIDRAIADYGIKQKFTPSKETDDTDDYVSVDNEVKTREQIENPYGFEKYVRTNFNDIPRDRYGYVKIEDCIRKLVVNEFPIHYEYLCQRLAYLYGNEKATVKIRREVDYGLRKLYGIVVKKGDFLYPDSNMPIIVRIPNYRKSQHISSDEFAAAMIKILGTYVGANRKTLCMETSRVYGFKSTGTTLAVSLNEAVDLLIKRGIVEETDGKLTLKE
ncbi:MAG: DUF4011 domain-containing protein [Clostridia bacterium]|nr:DUF4011 domain-containing protein [Clostridia bacterium]